MIPISKPEILEAEILRVTEAVSSGWVSSLGPYLDDFEQQFAHFCGVKHCITTANGTVAIHLALSALDIGAGDEVIVPDLTFAATINAVLLAGATPVIVDVCPKTWCINPALIEKAITPRTKAIIPVHLYGHPCDMAALNALAKKHDVFIIEDAAEAHGALYHNKPVGGLGDCATFSFYGNKIITTGEGGCITTNSDSIAAKARLLRDHGMSKEKRYWHTVVGFNYRMTNLQAALGLAQLEKIAGFLRERARILQDYRRFLSGFDVQLNPMDAHCQPVNWLTSVLLPNSEREERDQLIQALKDNGIETRSFFYPLSAMPIYHSYALEECPVAHQLSARGLNLPTYMGLSTETIQNISSTFIALTNQFVV